MTTTIPRNATRQIADLKKRLTRCRVLTLDNYFLGADTDPANAWAALERHRARLTVNSDGTVWTVQVHSNCWYELREAEPEPEPAAEPAPPEAAGGDAVNV